MQRLEKIIGNARKMGRIHPQGGTVNCGHEVNVTIDGRFAIQHTVVNGEREDDK
ncbi:hypothetical protein [Desulfosarcina ovata]|nr:hypothetical protein [Desulfosarcina ovata]